MNGPLAESADSNGQQAQIGIVIPAYNCASYLSATLDSIIEQSFQEWECVIVDDGSTDNTCGIANHYASLEPRIRLLKQSNAGPCVARNNGYAALSESVEYVTFMDADDVWVNAALERLKAALDQYPDVVAVHGLGDFIDKDGAPYLPGVFADLGKGRLGSRGGRIYRWPQDSRTTFETVVTSSVIFPPGLLLTRKEIYEQVGVFDEAMRYAEDWDMLIRISRRGDLHLLDEVILGYRRHDRNMGTGAAVPQACQLVTAKAFYSQENTPDQKKIMRDMWKARQRDILTERLLTGIENLKRFRIPEAIAAFGRIPFIIWRYLRGKP